MASSSSSSSSSSNNHDGNAHGIPVSIQGFEGFAVHPLDTCPHVELVETIPQEFELGHPCGNCEETKENWVCLTCYHIFCSRYVKGHMAEHSKNENHAIVMSFSDLSVWCFECDNYISNPHFRNHIAVAYEQKFGEKY